MRSRSEFIHARAAHNLAEGGGNVADIVMTWNEWPGDSVVNGVDGSRSGTPTQRNQFLRGFVHFVQPTTATQVRQHAEVEIGDCIVDFAADAPIDGKADARFQIAGREWVQKEISGRLAQSWDALVGGRKLFRTVLLRLAT